ncbi:hypothetical protein WJX81_008029 [Elliptochloris bilobata]|uniref:Peptidase C1A papain C-terminal domain-containing protein n=1 Tax=Elliptochloris bilobata TaxID=381761 RepID=A0AAW1RDF2_9CHLO
MNFFGWRSCCALLLAVLCAAPLAAGKAFGDSHHFALSVQRAKADPRGAFAEWAAHFGRGYAAGSDEFEARLGVWLHTLRHVLAAPLADAMVPVNGFADLGDDEFRAAYLGQVTPEDDEGNVALGGTVGKRKAEKYRYEHVQPPAAVDWRPKEIIGPVKDQHVNGSACGCCWAFATIGTAECMVAMATGKVLSLSEQQLIDCDRGPPLYDLGCDGGNFEGGILYISENGIDLESDYPYLAKDSVCSKKKEGRRAAALDGFGDIPRANETALMQAVSQHPSTVAVCCGPFIEAWRNYTGGIFDIAGATVPGGCTRPLDHALVAVGYGTTAQGQGFWVLKNSWGAHWGDRGFMYVPRNTGGKGACGLAAAPGYAIKKGVNAEGDALIDAATWSKPDPSAALTMSRAERLSLGSARAAITPAL